MIVRGGGRLCFVPPKAGEDANRRVSPWYFLDALLRLRPYWMKEFGNRTCD